MQRPVVVGVVSALLMTLAGCTNGAPQIPAPSMSSAPANASTAPANVSTAPAHESTPPADTSTAPAHTSDVLPSVTSSGSYPLEETQPDPDCLVTDEQVALLVRDWARVTESVGRMDHADYTNAMRKSMESISKDATECHGAEMLPTLSTLLDEVHQAAESDESDADPIHEFNEKGNDWLVELGYLPKLIE